METTATKSIIAEEILSKKGNRVWRVKVEGSKSKENTAYCKTALAAIKFCYILKKRTSCPISPISMDYLMYRNMKDKERNANLATATAEAETEATE